MARSRLSLVIVLLLVALGLLNADKDSDECSSSEEARNPDQNSDKLSLLCVTLVEPGCNVTLIVKDSYGSRNDTFTVDPGECATNHTDVLKVQAIKGSTRQINLKMSLGDCEATCQITRDVHDPPKLKFIRDNKAKEVLCQDAELPTFDIDTEDGDGLCTEGKKLKRTSPPKLSLSPTGSSAALVGNATNSTNTPALDKSKTSSTVLEIVLVLELVATCVMAVLVMWVMRSGGKKSGVTPATTDVRRNSHQGEVYICENDLYEPFTGPAAAQATGGQT